MTLAKHLDEMRHQIDDIAYVGATPILCKQPPPWPQYASLWCVLRAYMNTRVIQRELYAEVEG